MNGEEKVRIARSKLNRKRTQKKFRKLRHGRRIELEDGQIESEKGGLAKDYWATSAMPTEQLH